MKKFNIWLIIGLVCSLLVSGYAYLAAQNNALIGQYANLFIIATGAQLVFLVIGTLYDSYLFKLGASIASFCVIPSGFFTLIGFARVREDQIRIKHTEQAVESFVIAKKIIIGTTILNGIIALLITFFVANPFIKAVLLAYICLGFIDAIYRSQSPVVVFHKSCLTIKYSLFKPAKAVQYSRVYQMKPINKSIFAITEIVGQKPVTHVIAHMADLESKRNPNVPIMYLLDKAIQPLMATQN